MHTTESLETEIATTISFRDKATAGICYLNVVPLALDFHQIHIQNIRH